MPNLPVRPRGGTNDFAVQVQGVDEICARRMPAKVERVELESKIILSMRAMPLQVRDFSAALLFLIGSRWQHFSLIALYL
jgi:hypothetical protein